MELQKLLSYTRQAIDHYHMIDKNDHIAVGLSGGKDSLTLLCSLNALKRFYPLPFDLIAVFVDLGFQNIDLLQMKRFCGKLCVPLHIEETQISQIVFEQRKEQNPCSLCAKLRKGAMNDAVKKLGCNKIAYGHHRDDAVETMMMSLLYEGRFHSFAPNTFLERSGLYVIRPLLYVSEAEIIGFQRKQQLPVLKNPCPADGTTRREYVKQLLNCLNKENPGVRQRMFTALCRGLEEYQ